MNTITNNPDHSLIIAHSLIDDRIRSAQQRAQIHELRAVSRAERRQSDSATAPASTPATVPSTARTWFPNSVFSFLHGAR
jgi:hypothetical protein